MIDRESYNAYRREASEIVSRGEEIVFKLKHNRAYEGRTIVASQVLLALKRLNHLIEAHEKRFTLYERPAMSRCTYADNKNWWSIIKWPPKGKVGDFGTNI